MTADWAVMAPGRRPLSYRRLEEQVGEARAALHALGFGRGDRIALALPDGPELVTAFLAVSGVAMAAPLNPAYRVSEFDFYFSDLNASALLVAAASDSPAVEAARARDLPVLRLSPRREAEAGCFTLAGETGRRAAAPQAPRAGDIALLLHTSGTTSRPKLVPLTHDNLSASARQIAASLALGPTDRCLQVMPLFHVHGLIGATLATLASGGAVVCTPGFDPDYFLDWLAELEPTWYTAVPTLHQAVLAAAARHPELAGRHHLRFIRSCSAALPPKLMMELERIFQVPVVEAYGMTEAAHQMAANPLPPLRRKPGSVGVAAGTEVAVLEEAGRLLGPGQTGEVAVRGPNVMPGYLANPAANRSAFTGSWFRTGDQGYLDEDGYLFLTGRLKELINRGGEKISPREIDETLLDHPAVAQAAAFAAPHPTLGEDVAAAVVLRPGAAATENELRRFAAARLAAFKVPARIVFVDRIPKGPTGKLQRIGLAEKLLPPTDYVEPRTELERRVAGLWAEVLGRERVGLHDHFFELGGDSLAATRLVNRVRQTLAKEVLFGAVFETPRLGDFAAAVAAGRSPATAPIPRSAGSITAPASFPQRQIWFMEQLYPGSAVYNRPAALRLCGPLDSQRLEPALRAIAERHEVLRTRFALEGGEPVQVIGPSPRLSLTPVDLDRDQVARWIREYGQLPFDLEKGPLVRATLLRLAPQDHILALNLHHTVCDAWSFEVLWRELAAGYQGAALPELPLQYSDFARWQRSAGDQTPLEYWKQQLEGSPQVLELPADRTRPPVQAFRGARHQHRLPPQLAAALGNLGRGEQCTLFLTLLAGFQALLHRYTGQPDLLVGCPVAGRTRLETEPLLGCFINTLMFRSRVDSDPTFRGLLAETRRTALDAWAHQDLAFERLVETLHPARDLSRTPLVQVLFQLRHPPAPVSWPGLQAEELDLDPGIARFDLVLDVVPETTGLACRFVYNADLFNASRIERLAGHFQTLLEGVLENPDRRISELPLLSESERRKILVEWNDTRAAYSEQSCAHQLFEAQAARSAGETAAVCADQSLTYLDLNRRANRLAHYLRRRGVGPDVLVGLCVERSLDLPLSILAVWKAGGAYVPLDPRWPKARLRYLVEQTHLGLLLTQERLRDDLPECAAEILCLDRDRRLWESEDDANPPPLADPDHLAYVMFTSGSTGKPKGVLVPHRGVVNYLEFLPRAYGLSSSDVVLQLAPYSFDASVRELLGPLTTGGRLLLVPEGEARDPAALVARMEQHGVTATLAVVPTLLRALLAAVERRPAPPGRLRLLATAGEVLPVATVAETRRLFGEKLTLVNQYGPTECTMTSAWWVVTGEEVDTIPIGRPIPNAEIYLLDPNREPVPIGVPGELYIGGVGVARGYLGLPDQTAASFLPHLFRPEAGARLYRTGDLARYRPDGVIEFLGRRDNQVKVRGFRVELGEIEAVLAEHPAVRQAVVAARHEGPGDTRLAAYVVPHRPPVDPAGLRAFLRDRLPDYMVPNAVVELERLPLTSNGKVDRGALPAPQHQPPPDELPQDELEVRVAAIWAGVLGVRQVGRHEHFLNLGGNSLLAIRIMARVTRQLQVALPLAALFEAPTVASFTARLRAG